MSDGSPRGRVRRPLAWALPALVLALPACGRDQAHLPSKSAPPPPAAKDAPARVSGTYKIDLYRAPEREGTAVVVLVDTSGSMAQPVKDAKGQMRPKHLIAREALSNIIRNTAQWQKGHPQAPLSMGLYTFSSSVNEVLPVGDFDAARAEAALARIPSPNSGTAIGQALEAGFKALYRSGCRRKFLICVTDGENTTGPPPDWIARNLYGLTDGGVEMHFVAFDTQASRFAFLKEVNGQVVQADDGARLQNELNRIYEERILVEKEDVPGK